MGASRALGQCGQRWPCAQDLKKHDLLRVTTAADAANIVAQMDGLLQDREAPQAEVVPSVESILGHMSAYMGAAA